MIPWGKKFFESSGEKNGSTTQSGISLGEGQKKGRGGQRNKREHFKFRLSQVHIPQILANTATNPNCGHSGVRIKERVTSNNRCNDWKLLNHSLEEGGGREGNGPSLW